MQRIGNAVDVVEVADDLGGIVDGAIIEVMLAELDDVVFGHLGRGEGELFSVGA